MGQTFGERTPWVAAASARAPEENRASFRKKSRADCPISVRRAEAGLNTEDGVGEAAVGSNEAEVLPELRLPYPRIEVGVGDSADEMEVTSDERLVNEPIEAKRVPSSDRLPIARR